MHHLSAMTNDQLDFIHFVCEAGCLGAGDYLICDNAQIHGAANTFEILTEILKMAGVELVYLPSYSPELIFMQVKRHLQEYQDMTISLWAG
jgi:hypothetical protein